MYRFQYSVCTNAGRTLAWQVFSDWRRWNSFANIYGELRWHQGQPWQIGSRMHIELRRPLQTVVDHLIIACEPAEEIGWIDRAVGITLGQWVRFDSIGSDKTRIKTWGEVAPSGVEIAERPVEHHVAGFIETWYENFRIVCDQLAAAGQA